ncbi:MAG: hypothetical protein WDN24_09340 [Sphingomonas sp.]
MPGEPAHVGPGRAVEATVDDDQIGQRRCLAQRMDEVAGHVDPLPRHVLALQPRLGRLAVAALVGLLVGEQQGGAVDGHIVVDHHRHDRYVDADQMAFDRAREVERGPDSAPPARGRRGSAAARSSSRPPSSRMAQA